MSGKNRQNKSYYTGRGTPQPAAESLTEQSKRELTESEKEAHERRPRNDRETGFETDWKPGGEE